MLALALSLLIAAPDDGEIVIPAIGRPSRDFYNAAGERVLITASVDRVELNPGDWLVYTLRIDGLKNAKDVERPKLDDLEGFRQAFQIEQLPESDAKDSRVFSYRLRPRDPTVREIPPFAFRYYDPRDQNAETAFRLTLAKAIPLKIASVPVDASKISAEEFYDRWRRQTDPLDEYAFLYFVILYPILLIAIHERRPRRSSAASRKAVAEFRRLSNRPIMEQAERARSILRNYLRDRLTLDEVRQTVEEFRAVLKPPVAEPVEQFLSECDAILYGHWRLLPDWLGRFREISKVVEGNRL